MKQAKVRKTPLDWIVAQLHTTLRRVTKDVIAIGKLLIESRKYLGHGEWQGWLQENFDLSYRTVLNYCDAAEYVDRKSKSATVADFSALAPTVLYALAAGQYSAEEEAAILAATGKGRVDQTRASAICDDLASDPEEPDQPDDDDEAAEDPESTAILDGPPPDVPPPAPNITPDVALRAFDQAVNALKQLMTKPAARFASTVHAGDLEGVENFIHAVADQVREARKESGGDEVLRRLSDGVMSAT
jgi:Protein of unknown function (DUF3102)